MPNYASGSNDRPVPMEVDRVEKGKGKHKSKNKGRGSLEEVSGQAIWSGRRRGRTNKGKGKGKTRKLKVRKEIRRWIRKKGGGRSKVTYGQCPIAWSLDIGVVTAQYVFQRGPEGFRKTRTYSSKPIYSCCEIHSNSAENLSVWWYTFQSFIPNFSYLSMFVSGAHGFIS